MNVLVKFTLLAIISYRISESAITTNEKEKGRGFVLEHGEVLVLQCNDTNNPEAPPAWILNNVPLNSTDKRIKIFNSNNSLVILNTQEHDCGFYTCLIDSPGGNVQDKQSLIPVRSRVKLVPVESPRNVVQNQKVVLMCNATQGTPTPKIEWQRNNMPLNTSDTRIKVKDENRVSKLIITDVKFEDAGDYCCIGKNEVSSDNTTVVLNVKDKYSALWPFLAICAEVAIVCTIIFIYERKKKKPNFEDQAGLVPEN